MQFFRVYLLYSLSQKNKLTSLFAAFNTLDVFNLLEIVQLILIRHRMNHSIKRRRQALNKTHHHYYLNTSVEAANVSNWRIESNRKKIDSVARIESNRNFFARIGMLYRSAAQRTDTRGN